MIIKNKGMYLETIINNSISILDENNGFIYKMPINNNIISINNNIITARLKRNYFCDYIGLWKGIYLEFEAKETEKDYFNLNNLKQQQFEKLTLVNKNNGCAFILVYFHLYEKIFFIHISELSNIKNKKIPYQYFKENFLEINFSGINFNFNDIFNHLINYT
ncbi:Holliday junction resolvase RecU [Spiroplasma cantharicola]|uniref:Holliday junction resolvase RecU n=1 Tax=Spiroplasma cantharicola TaxID=362837 RepID=A0A0M4KC25_9MOLU|nr:Holliday junction resolvase RecU [Spiroplasma cantharicola]ALD66177.1 Holliday junction-specific endonuclease [Spiroplasma cantharicola]